jgi:acyl dehydratase
MGKFYNEEELSKKILDLDVGDKYATKLRTMTQTDLELNAIVNGDYHPMFFSEEAAKKMGWKRTLFPGLVTLNIAIGLLIQSRVTIDTIGFLGMDKIKFRAPVYPGDTIRFELELVSKKQNSKNQWIIDYKFEVKNDKNEVCIEGYNC